MKISSFLHLFLLFFGTSVFYAQPGTLDPDFGGGDGVVTTSFFAGLHTQGNGVALQADGRILVSGYTRGAGQTEHATLLRFLPNGELDNGFNGSGKMIISADDATNSVSRAVAIQPDGKILLLANHYNSQGAMPAIYRFLEDGSPDTDFASIGMVVTDVGARYLSANAVTFQPDGKIVIGGYIGFADDPFDAFFVIRYLSDGTPDPDFGDNGFVITRVGESWTSVYDVLIQSDGKIIAAGYAVFNGYEAFAVVRYHANGTPDQTFGGDGIAYISFGDGNDVATGVALQPDGKIVLGGYAYNIVTNKTEFAAARLTVDGEPDNSFHGDGKNTYTVSGHADGANSVLLQPDGKIVLGGYAHSNISGGADMAVVRIQANGIPDPSFDGDGVAIYEDGLTSSVLLGMALQPDGKIVGTGFVRKEGVNATGVIRFRSGLTVSTDESPLPDMDISLYPNPVFDHIIVAYELDRTETFFMHLVDMQGRFVQVLQPPTKRQPGVYREKFNLGHLSSGPYMVHIESKSWKKTVIVLVK